MTYFSSFSVEVDNWFGKKSYGTSVCGYTMSCTFYMHKTKYIVSTLLNKKSETSDSFKEFFTYEGVPTEGIKLTAQVEMSQWT